jgi:SAM-dependent methyltransferase
MMDMGAVLQAAGRVRDDLSGAVVSILCGLGDRLGLFKVLATQGPATAEEFAARAGINTRYALEWLSALACAGYLDYDPAARAFSMRAELAPVLAFEPGPFFMGGAYQQLPAFVAQLDRLAHAFREGDGVPQESYGEDLRAGMERMSAGWFDAFLVQMWVPCMPDVQASLERGADVADVGCGGGRALINLARAFPRSRFVGYDLSPATVARAAENAARAGVADRVRFECRDVAEGLPGQYDLITTFDSVHDFGDPPAGLRSIRAALRPGGTYLLMEMNSADRLEDNFGPVGAILFGTSVLYNLPVSLMNGGAGLGTMGLPEGKLRELCAAAGFSTCRRLPVENPFNVLYEVRAESGPAASLD